MNKEELIEAITDEIKGNTEDTKKYLDAFIKIVKKTLGEGTNITLDGLGTLQAKRNLSNKNQKKKLTY